MKKNVRKVVRCLVRWQEGQALWALPGHTYEMLVQRDDGIFIASESGIKWVTKDEYIEYFRSSKTNGVDDE